MPPASSYRQAAHGARSVLEATTSLSRAPDPPTLFFSNIGAAAPAPAASPATFQQQPSLQRKAARTVAWELDEASSEAAEVQQQQPLQRKGLVTLLRDSYPKSPTRPSSAAPAHVPVAKPASRVPVTPSRSAIIIAASKPPATTTSKPLVTTTATTTSNSKRGVKVTANDAAVAAALHVLRSRPPSQPLIQALLRYTTYNPQILAFEGSALSKSKRPGSAGAGIKRGKGTAASQSTRLAAKASKSPVKHDAPPAGNGEPTMRDSVASEGEQLIMSALQQNYGEPGWGQLAGASQFEDDTALRQEMEANFSRSERGVGQPTAASTLGYGATAHGAGHGALPSLGGPAAGRSSGAHPVPAVKKLALDPGLLFSIKQQRVPGGEESGATMLQKQMAQMAAAMAGMGGLSPPGGPMAAAAAGGPPGSGGFQASSVVLWEVMSLVLMRSVLSSAVGAMSSQMTSMAQQVRPGGGIREVSCCHLCRSVSAPGYQYAQSSTPVTHPTPHRLSPRPCSQFCSSSRCSNSSSSGQERAWGSRGWANLSSSSSHGQDNPSSSSNGQGSHSSSLCFSHSSSPLSASRWSISSGPAACCLRASPSSCLAREGSSCRQQAIWLPHCSSSSSSP